MKGILNDYCSLIELLSVAGEIDGRKKLQKMVYILKSLGAGFTEDFYFHYYGPYSDTLTVELEELKSMGIIDEIREIDGAYYKYKYRIKIAENDVKSGLEEYESIIHTLNGKNARFLELVATIIYFLQENYSREQICYKIKIVKNDKNYTDAEIEAAFNFLKEIQYGEI